MHDQADQFWGKKRHPGPCFLVQENLHKEKFSFTFAGARQGRQWPHSLFSIVM
jgi:hypothetical protein